ncbi:MAG: ATP phosphoribosyltransferase [Actinobacteria bacterium]|nr:MAG: ATP phosphoribosyltransferase [Actinomycetota bacterium]
MLSIALPKGSLEEQTLKLFEQADLEVKREYRGYNPIIKDERISKVKILRPQEIPTYVADGYFDLGIAGQDCRAEADADVVEVALLPYAKTGAGILKMVVAVHESSPVEKVEDIKPGSRVTTEFPNLTARYFEKLGIPVKVFYSHGATEAKIPELMDVVVDITETGQTLLRNKLKIIGLIMESQTALIANPASWEDPEKRRAIEEIKTLLLGVIEARGRVLISMNVPEEKLEDVISQLPALKFPTVSQLYNSHYLEVVTVVDKSTVNVLIPKLKAHGAEDILELGISKIVR